MYVGESERAIRSIFTRARHSSPCVIFFDEIDALCPKRQSSSAGGSEHSARLVNQMLTEMDGIQNTKSTDNSALDSIFVMAATNRPDMLDPALLRPGRLDKTLYVGFPTVAGKVSILQALSRKRPTIDPSIDLEKLATDARMEKLSGADIASVIREASMVAMHSELEKCLKAESHKFEEAKQDNTLKLEHFEVALSRVKPSINDADRKSYQKMEQNLKK